MDDIDFEDDELLGNETENVNGTAANETKSGNVTEPEEDMPILDLAEKVKARSEVVE